VFGILLSVSVIVGSLLGLSFAMYHDLPGINDLERYKPNVVTRVLAEDGRLISELYLEKRIWVPYRNIPNLLKNAILDTEDDQFFSHQGIRLLSILRALVVDIRLGRMAQGGSTITQQLAKQLFLTPEKSIMRKIKEALLAIQIEKKYTKREILELYLNQIYLGSGAYGVEAASQIYFGKSVSDLSLAQTAMLAGLPRAPSRYSPFNNMELAKQRRTTVLSRMRAEKHISPEEETAARAEPVTLAKKEGNGGGALHFVETVRQYLEQKYGKDRLYREGLIVTTTLDLEMQKAAEKAVTKGALTINERIRSARVLTDKAEAQAALVAVRPKDGAVLAMVGGVDFSNSQFNRAISSHRQPGSAFKPFVFMAAIDKGLSPADTIIDSPVSYKDPSHKGGWKPTNFSHKFYGPVTLRTMLENSINVASIKLLDKVGIDHVISLAKRCGIQSPLAHTLSLALGSSEVTPLELTSAFATLANSGIRAEPFFIVSIKNSDNEILEERTPSFQDAIRPEVAYVTTNLLKGVVQNGTGRAAKALNRPVAGKTGTTNDYRDAWFVGYTPDLAAGVWVGFDDNRSMGRGQTGGRTAAPIWVDFMIQALKDHPVLDFTPPDSVVIRTIDRESGKLATRLCRDTFEEMFVAGSEPVDYCTLEREKDMRL